MKKIKKSIVLALGFSAAISILNSCNVTDITPDSALTGDSFYKTRDDATAAVMSVYAQLTNEATTNRIFNWGDARAEQSTHVPAWNGDGAVIAVKRQQISITTSLAEWAPLYTVIQRANEAIKGITPMETNPVTFTPEEKNRLIGEALSLRAWAYFTLVRTFRDVPLVLDPSDRADKDYAVKQSPEAEVLDQVEKDLKQAISIMPRSAQGRNNFLRATRGMAKATLTHVLLWRNKYAEAETAATDLITSEGYALAPSGNYLQNFINGTNENIFSLGFTTAMQNPLQRRSSTNNAYGLAAATSWVARYRDTEDLVRGNFNGYLEISNNRTRVMKFSNTGRGNTAPATPNPGIWDNGAWQAEPNVAPRDFTIFRLADIYLLRAEARNRLSKTKDALDDINLIRTRAKVTPYTETSFTTMEAWEDAILAERDIELCFEGQRWFDLVRVARRNRPDVLITNATSILSGSEKTQAEAFLRDRAASGGWFLPVSRNELANNKNLVQLDAYK